MSADPFASIIGHETAKDVLRRTLDGGRLPHALLIVGPAGVGRRTLAEALMRAFLRTITQTPPPADAASAGSPPPSASLRTGLAGGGNLNAHPDFLRLVRQTDAKTGKEKSAIGIEQVRDLRERLGLSSLSGRKAAFIEEADCLSPGAANALLKTLEEPRGNVLIVLRAPQAESVPATIASRCQTIRLHSVPRTALAAALAARGLSRDEAADMAARSGGAPGRALRLMRDGAARTEADVGLASFLSAAEGPLYVRLRAAAALLPRDEANKAAVLDATMEAWERAARDALLGALGCGDLCAQRDARLDAFAGRVPVVRLASFLRTVSAVRADAAHHVNPQLALEHLVLQLTPGRGTSPRAT